MILAIFFFHAMLLGEEVYIVGIHDHVFFSDPAPKTLGSRSPYSFNFLVSYNFQANRSYMAWKVFQEMRSQNCKPNICTYTAMVNAFARDGLCEKAEEVFEQLQEDGYEPDVYAYNALMEAYR